MVAGLRINFNMRWNNWQV